MTYINLLLFLQESNTKIVEHRAHEILTATDRYMRAADASWTKETHPGSLHTVYTRAGASFVWRADGEPEIKPA